MPILVISGTEFTVDKVVDTPTLKSVFVDKRNLEVTILKRPDVDATRFLVRSRNSIFSVTVKRDNIADAFSVRLNGRLLSVKIDEASGQSVRDPSGEEGPILVTSPMAGKILSVKASVGRKVESGQTLIILEAMKMENEIGAPKKGTVKEIYVTQGKLAKPGDKLLLVE